jgi:DNA-binding CsgD family transcriptional regulator
MTALDRTELYFSYFAYDPQDEALKLRFGIWRDTEGSAIDACQIDPQLRFSLNDDKAIVAEVSRSGVPMYVPDAQCPSGEHWIDGYQVRSAFLVPVGSTAGGPCDVVVVFSHELDGFDEGERSLVVALVGYLSRAVGEGVGSDLRLRQVERGLRRIALEVSELGIDANGPGASAYPTALVERLRLVSPREWEVLERLRTGLRVATIARELEISPNTVRNHLKSIYRKLGVRSQTELLEQLRGSACPSSRPTELEAADAA